MNLINDCYNANPGSMAMALATLMELRDHGRAVAALGDMLELGLGPPPTTGPWAVWPPAWDWTCSWFMATSLRRWPTGPSKPVSTPDHIFPVASRAEGARILRELLAPGDWLLVKGSRSMHMEGLIDRLEES